MTEVVIYSVDADGICTLTMDLPGKPMNVLGPELLLPLIAGADRAIADPAVKGIIITSGKDSFLAGSDLKAMDSRPDNSNLPTEQLFHQLTSMSRDLRRLEVGGKPIACAINGTAVGGGFEIPLACHYRVVLDDPSIRLGLPEVNVGLLPGGGGTQRLLRMIGVTAAGPLLMQGTLMSPADALKAKLVDKLVPRDQLLSECKRWLLEEGDAVKPWDKKGFQVPGTESGMMSKELRGFFSANNAITKSKTYGNYPAANAIASCLFEGALVPMDAGLRVEGRYFVEVFRSSVSKSLIRTMFVNKGRAEKLEARPEGVPKVKYEKIGILGAGTMGAGLALNAAKSGIEVVLLDREQAAADKGKEYAIKKLNRDLEKGRTTQEKIDKLLARIHPTSNYADLKGAQLVIEAVFEDRQVKKAVIEQAEAVLSADVIFASNTSAMPITGLAEFSQRPDQFIGMHFFSPAERMPLVEIIRGKQTSDATLAKALDLAQALGKTPITVNDSPGFFTSRFIGSFVSESLKMAEEGINPNLIESGARMVGMPMGALTISDAMGLDLAHHASTSRAKEAGLPLPKTLIGSLVAEGRNGMKNGKGFFDYGPEGSKKLWQGLAALLPKVDQQPAIEEIKKRILYAQLAEGARAFAEGVLTSVIDGDLGATLGVGFPAYLGGPFSAMDNIGIANVVAECDRLAAAYGKQFELPQLLRDMAKNGQMFFGSNAVKSPGARAG